MPFEVRQSQLQDRAAFEQAVFEHVERLKEFNGSVGKPRPTAHPLIEACVKRTSYPKASKKPDEYAADYVIIDDSPPPPPEPAPLALEDRKRMLVMELRAAEVAAKESVLPARKHRLLLLQAGAAQQKLKAKDGQIDDSYLNDDEKAKLAEVQRVQAGYNVIELAAAQAESDIEDLTDDTVDSWQLPQLG